MKKLLFGLVLFFAAIVAKAQLTQQSVAYAGAPNGIIWFYQYKPPHYSTATAKLPMIISLHGGGEANTTGSSAGNPGNLSSLLLSGIPYLLSQGNVLEFTWQGKTEGFVMLAPQVSQSDVNTWPSYFIDQMIAYGINNLNVDPDRVFLTGYSLGGSGTWNYATSSAANAAKLAGIVPASAVGGSGNFCNIANNQVATWVHHGQLDQYTQDGGQSAINKTNAVNACSPLLVPAVDTIYPGYGHEAYLSKAYDFTNNTHYPNVFQWMLKVSRKLNPATNQNPIPVATLGVGGQSNVTLNLPVTFKNLMLIGDQSTDPDDIIMDYLWAQTAGPAVYFGSYFNHQSGITTEQWPNTALADPNYSIKMQPGNYQFKLRVKDYLTSKPGHTQFATINLTVQYPPGSSTAAPAVDAGNSRTINTNMDSQNGNAEAYSCANCYITHYNWSIESWPAGASPVLRNSSNTGPYTDNNTAATFTNLTVDGVYKFKYSVTNAAGDVGSDILTITRQTNSALPVSYAYINATNSGNNNVISWATTSEINSERFDVQRSIDGLSFSTIGSVQSVGGATTTDYHFTDENAPAGLSYYRLSQVDKDGKSALSKVVSANNKKTGIYVERYPNPAHDNLNVTIQSINNGSVQVVVADMQGKTILQQQWQKDQPQLKKLLNVNALQNGVYQMIITLGQERKVSSFVKY